MNGYSNTFALLLSLFSLILNGCSMPIREPKLAEFNILRLPSEPKEIKRISIVKSGKFEYIGNEPFGAKMASLFEKCNIAVQMITISPLDLDESIYDKKIKDFKPDSILYVKNRGSNTIRMQSSYISSQYFDIDLISINKELIWNAHVTIFPEGSGASFKNRSERFAIELSNKMKEGNVFPTCRTPEGLNIFDARE